MADFATINASFQNMPIEQLSVLRQRTDGEIEFMTTSIATLRKALVAFEHVKVAATKVKESQDGQDCLVPVGSTLYVKGKLEDPDKVLVDVGAGYFIEMSADRAIDHYQRKVDKIRGEVDGLKSIVQQKSAIREIVMQAIQKKVQTMTAKPPATS
ncbi:unnamed protein product [Bursaphelenchus okinawaensis]|uniref:Prefoldin subunit 5 n=1 Tax=Bursaphelenchus okinawaensis TaxID=465554 RepID=A0A811KKG5_9BILA|nr:unnamed protein product [Bursaphelenchus okinawaensis]CAG9105105.1 unnamed protein product [Bursaphelenchus okinawaensis]